MKLCEAIKHVFVLNLDRRTDRWKNFTEQWNNLNMSLTPERVTAIEKGALTPEMSVNLSMLYMWGRATAIKGHTLILEDDAIFSKKFNELYHTRDITGLSDSDLLYLGASWVKFSSFIGDDLVLLDDGYGAFGYVVSPITAKILIHNYSILNTDHSLMVDQYIKKVFKTPNMRRLMVYPSWVTFVNEIGDLYSDREINNPLRVGNHFIDYISSI